jgi:hypothetical protein
METDFTQEGALRLSSHNRNVLIPLWFNTPSLARVLLLVGGDTSIQRGGFYAAAPWHIFQATPSMFRALLWADGDTSIRRGGFSAADRGAVFKQRPQHNLLCLFRARLLVGGEHLSSVAGSLPLRRGRVFKQRPKHNLLYGWAVSIFPAWRVLCCRTVAHLSSNAPSTTCCAYFGRGFGWGVPGGRDGKGQFFVQNGPRSRFSAR